MNKNIKNKLTGLVSASRALRTLVVAALCMTGTFASAQETLWKETWGTDTNVGSVAKYNPEKGKYSFDEESAKHSDTKIVKGTSAGGVTPELQLGQSDVFTVTLTSEELSNYSGNAKLTYHSNRPNYVVTANGKTVTFTSKNNAGTGKPDLYTGYIDIVSGEDLVLTFTNAVDRGRLDDFELTKIKMVTINASVDIDENETTFVVDPQEGGEFAKFSVSDSEAKGKFSLEKDNGIVTISSDGVMKYTGNPGRATVVVKWISDDAAYADATIKVPLGVSKSVTLSDESPTSPEPCALAKITFNRNFAMDAWNTICVPFNMTLAKAESAFGTKEAKPVLLKYDEANSNGNKVAFVKADKIEAGVPYLIKPTRNKKSYEITLTPILATEAQTVGAEGGVRFCGTYIRKDITEGGSVNAAGITADNKIVKANQGGEMKGFRAYFILPEGVSAASYMLDLDGTVTSIDKVNLNGEVNIYAPVYNLNGQRVNGYDLQRGIYIQNGKKFVVK